MPFQLWDQPTMPPRAGIGLRALHHQAAMDSNADIAWLEVHSENYFGDGGAPLFYLEAIRDRYLLSLHGVGLSLGSVDGLNTDHLHKLKRLIQRIKPSLVSEHLSWGSFGGRYLNDLAPLPYTEASLAHVAARISETQDFLGRAILIENPSSYLEYAYSTYSESGFINELVKRTGCGVLLDVNNVYVSCVNHGWDAQQYLQELSADGVGEIHLAGHTANTVAGRRILIDTHNCVVCPAVWDLYEQALAKFGRIPTLIEWDADLPDWQVLVAQAAIADRYLEACDVPVS